MAKDAVNLVDQLIRGCLDLTATDLHIDPGPDQWKVRIRRDGLLETLVGLAPQLATQVVSRLKVLSELLTYRNDIPQEGRLLPQAGADGRVSTFPTIHGEKLALRFFPKGHGPLSLDELGLQPEILAKLKTLLLSKDGAILLTGPGGSGKTTTLYAALEWISRANQGASHIFTIEDPVERALAGINQSQVRPGTEFDFARGLRSLLRQDPEVVMVGEIRDPQTAATAMEAAMTGHLLLSTIHAGMACGVFGRLLDMGVEPYALTSGIRGVLNQRLVRRLCRDCLGEGCPSCGRSGFKGRLLLAELVEMKPPLRKAILARADLEELVAATRESGETGLRTAAKKAIDSGETSQAEIDRVLGPNVSSGEWQRP